MEANTRILLIEDNPADARLVREALRGRPVAGSFLVETAGRLDEGLAALRDGKFDAILLDLSLPDSSGIDTFRAVRDASPGTPVLILTGLDDEAVGQAAVAEGAQDFVLKRTLTSDILPRAIMYAVSRMALLGQLEDQMEQLRDSEARYRTLVDGVDAVVWESDLRRERFRFVSSRAETLLGYPAAELTVQPGFWESRVHPGDLSRVRPPDEGGGPKDHVVEYRIKSADGRWVWVRDVVRVLRDGRGRPRALSGVMIDVTEVVAIQQYRENLLDIISHEFRTPVTVIQGYAQILTDTSQALKPDAAASARDKIGTASRHLAYLLGTITELSRLRTGGAPPLINQFSSREVVAEAIEALTARGRGYDGPIEVLVSPGAEDISGDRRKLLISLVELLDNAAKFSPRDGSISVLVHDADKSTVLTVKDRGPGIPDTLRDNLFKPFVQGDMTAVRATGGAGLGLAVVAGLVRAQGGRVEVETAIGQGTAIHIVLPRT